MALEALCIQHKVEYIRFDYGGHGDSGGDFADGCISEWLNDTMDVIEQLPQSKEVVLVGSSMGGWISLLAAIANPTKVRGLFLIACAVDMTRYYPERLKGLALKLDGQGRQYYKVPNEYDEQDPYRIYQRLIDDGQLHMLLDDEIDLRIPVRLIHGVDDDVVEWQRSEQVLSKLKSMDVSLQLIKGGDHRLSSEQHLVCIANGLLDLLQVVVLGRGFNFRS